MKDRINFVRKEIARLNEAKPAGLQKARAELLGRKGSITALFQELKSKPPEDKKKYGKILNELKQEAESRLAQLAEALQPGSRDDASLDLTLPHVPNKTGNLHPLTLTRNRIIEIFERLGFSVAEGPEIEDDWHNFSALNFPENHPAREMQDTFFISRNPDLLLRTHTSNVQIRLMENGRPPFRSIMPGRVFRNEAISARAHCFFHQVEGLYVDRNVSFADLKQTLYYFAREMFDKDTGIRFRPSYFPFTEPSAEIDITCLICKGNGCNICKHSGWVEIAGAGMVHPAVLENCHIDPNAFTGFAFGMGIERINMLKYGVTDLRQYSENDIRFLRQFGGLI